MGCHAGSGNGRLEGGWQNGNGAGGWHLPKMACIEGKRDCQKWQGGDECCRIQFIPALVIAKL
jgi:hypothetical protein